MTGCQVCGTENPESAEVCCRCGVALDASPTISISRVEPARGHHDAQAAVASSHDWSPPPGFAPGTMVAERYRVVSLLGRGGMGEVYGADDLKLGQRVALKFLPTERGKSPSWRDQFYAEVRIARQVSHPNVCRVYDVGESDGRLFLSMEFVDGEDLASLLRRIGRLPDDKAVEVAQQLCAGLAAAHRSGVLHRDLKPANVMIDGKGRARITDFGLAIAADEAGGKAGPAGTPGYLAPELAGGVPPSVQSDLYALGLVFYELFTGKKAFDASNLAELHRKQTETNPTPPSIVVKNFDPAVERAILRCLEHDPSQRPRSALSVAAALPGGDPLSAALASGETPSPEMVAAAGPQASLRPAVSWACLAAAIALIFVTSFFLSPLDTDWGLASMNKSPEVLADRAQELTHKLGYATAVDRAFWIASEADYLDYAARNPSGKDWKRPSGQTWPSSVGFWYRQSPQWMMPEPGGQNGPQTVSQWDPPYETSCLVTLKLDMQGKLLFLRAVPPQVESRSSWPEPNWDLLFAEAGLDRSRFASAGPKWNPPETFDSRADWEGQLADHPDLPIHVTAASFHGVPVYFQVIAPWDQPWRKIAANVSSITQEISTAIEALFLIAYAVVGCFFARRNLRVGRGDTKGALRLAGFVFLANVPWSVLSFHLVPRPDYISDQFVMLGIPLFFAAITWVGYMAVEPYARRRWPKLMVSWQRLLGGCFRDPLVGRDLLVGGLAGSLIAVVLMSANAWVGISKAFPVSSSFGQGLGPSIGWILCLPARTSGRVLAYLAILTIMTGIFRRRGLGLAATGLVLIAIVAGPNNATDFFLSILFVAAFLATLIGVSLVGAVCFYVVWLTLAVSPPLGVSQWYAGRAMIALLLPLALLGWGFFASLRGQPILGSALNEQ